MDSFAGSYRLPKRSQTEDDGLPHLRRLLVVRSLLARHHRLWDGSRRPQGGAGPPACTGTRHKAPRTEGSAVTRLCAGCHPARRKPSCSLSTWTSAGGQGGAAAVTLGLGSR